MQAPSYFPESKHALLTDLADGLEPGALSWLSGYFAGMAQSRQAVRAPAAVAAAAGAGTAKQITIVYGSQTGNAKRTAEALAERCAAQGLDARLVRADRYVTRELKDERLLYIVMSTQGDGEPPDDSRGFVEFLTSRRAPKLPQTRFAVLGLGDSSYPLFCGIAVSIDARLAELGGIRVQDVGMADLDLETVTAPWQDRAVALAQKALRQNETPSASVTALRPKPSKASRDNPFLAELLLNQPITGRNSDKDIRHLEISLEGGSLNYRPGDSLGVWPTQAPALVADVIALLNLDGDEPIEINGASLPLTQWLSHRRELTTLTRPFLAAHAELAQSEALKNLLQPGAHEAFRQLLDTHQLIDLLKHYPAPWGAADFVKALRPLTPRLYSIASSPACTDNEVHLTLAHVAYDRLGESRWGVASHFLTELAEGQRLPVFIEENPRFRLPDDSARDVIMIGPGTGIAPFRAFVQERGATAGGGRNWLFFGNPRFDSDFLYQTEWQAALREGHVHRLDLAFSRDQDHKIYVQDRMLEHAAELYRWIEGGAYIYVCGDANRMARDVHQTLLRIARDAGGLDADQAGQWLDSLARQGRYARDVY